MKGRYAEKDNDGNKCWQQGGYWFAYAGCFQGDVLRGKGATKEDAIKNSIKNTQEEK